MIMTESLSYRLRLVGIVLCISWSLIGCSDEANTPGGGTDVPIGQEVSTDGAGGLDVALPAVDTVTIPEDVSNALEKPCNGPQDCPSGWCVESPDGQVCTTTCLSECPEGWECREVFSASGDPVYICISLLARLCHPCTNDSDCTEAASVGKNKCISFGENGSFCGIRCIGQDNACPSGYVCDENAFEEPQCVPVSGECTCNGLATILNLATTCSQTNEDGQCLGQRVCSIEGLSDCDAPAPAIESCNGIDDDCDGVTDEGLDGGDCELSNEFGTCIGTLSCELGAKTCMGLEPSEEKCNGIDDNCDGATDESYPDNDGDGVADCVDEDSDDDGTPNINDCAPNDPTVFPGAVEICDSKDNDCNNLVDDEGAIGCKSYYADADLDGYGSDSVKPKCLCDAEAASFYTALNNEDCNDLNPLAFPGGQEVCNAEDDDCDGETDELEDLPSCEISNGFGTCEGQMTCLKGVFVCDGQTPLPEECNGVDDDCNGKTDEGMLDSDFDGIADCVDDDDDNDGTKDVLDCEPFNPQVHVNAVETCNGVDENCNGIDDDEDAVGCKLYYQDADQDGFGSDKVEARCFCESQPVIYFTADKPGDCNDIAFSAFPGGVEVCNGLDDNCDGVVDDGVAAPCGGCEDMCVLEVGSDKSVAFEVTPFNSSNVVVTASGSLLLDTPNGLSGYYRHILKGWPVNNTYWDFMVANVVLPGDGQTWLQIRYRTANSEVELALANWMNAPQNIPPAAFPVNFQVEGRFLELELKLNTQSAGKVPIIDNVTVIASEIVP